MCKPVKAVAVSPLCGRPTLYNKSLETLTWRGCQSFRNIDRMGLNFLWIGEGLKDKHQYSGIPISFALWKRTPREKDCAITAAAP